jgi:putative transposase
MAIFAAHRTIEIALALNLVPCFTPVESPESNGMAEAFVKTFKRDCVRVSPILNAAAALALIDNWMDDYNTVHPHSQLGYRSPLYDPSAKPGDDDQKGYRPADQKPLHLAHRYPPLS